MLDASSLRMCFRGSACLCWCHQLRLRLNLAALLNSHRTMSVSAFIHTHQPSAYARDEEGGRSSHAEAGATCCFAIKGRRNIPTLLPARAGISRLHSLRFSGLPDYPSRSLHGPRHTVLVTQGGWAARDSKGPACSVDSFSPPQPFYYTDSAACSELHRRPSHFCHKQTAPSKVKAPASWGCGGQLVSADTPKELAQGGGGEAEI